MVDGGDSYTVTIVDDTGRTVGRPVDVSGPALDLQDALPRGRIYGWQVSAERGGKRFTAPIPPAPPARFLVLDRATVDRLSAIERAAPDSHLLLGILYAQEGAALESIAHLMAVKPEHPHYGLARRLLAQAGAGSQPAEDLRVTPRS
jgi:hypothetical protein